MPNVIDDFFPSNIIDLNVYRSINDEHLVYLIIVSIKFQIYYNIQNNLDTTFTYDTTEWIGDYPLEQQSRVIDRVIRFFRKRGIKCRIANGPNFNFYSMVGAEYNATNVQFQVLTISFVIRNEREFMKSYFN